MITRKQYMDKEVTHREYYAQFVTPGIKQIVKRRFGLNVLLETRDQENLNSIPLIEWDMLTGQLWQIPGLAKKLTDAGCWAGIMIGVCILKEAAKQLIEEEKASLESRAR